MSINWVMLDDARHFVSLPREKILYTSPPRTTLALEAGNTYPGKEPLAISCGSGTAYITNQRLIYLPADATPQFQSFSAPILNLQDTHVSAPLFGPNVWYGVLQPVPGGGIPAHHAFVKIKMTFKEGGAYDFLATYERIKETLYQAAETARESGRVTDLSELDLEPLPAYEEIGQRTPATPNVQRPTPISPSRISRPYATQNGAATSLTNSRPSTEPFPPPDEPPPGYEETQRSSVANNLEESVRQAH